jgi:hypothetical protein
MILNQNFDFSEDLRSEISLNFKRWLIRPNKTKPINEYLVDYLTILKKLIDSKPRVVRYSPTLEDKLKTHPKKREIVYLSHLFSKGGNLNIFQSKRLLQTSFHDHLLYEWNIHHFHLSIERPKGSIFVKQVAHLLFVYVDSTQAIFLGVDKHSDGVFADVKWLEILHDYFPEVIEPFKDRRASEHFLVSQVAGEELQRLWDKGYTVGMTKVRDKVYRNPGIGRMTSGHSILVTKQCNEILVWLHQAIADFQAHYSEICKFLNLEPLLAKFKLRFGSVTLEVFEETSNKVILTYPERVDAELFHKSNFQN